MGILSEVAVAQALSSPISWKILNLLMANELEEREISKSLDIPARLVKLHISKLVQAGIVTERERLSRSARVMQTYRISGTGKSIGFPPRNYLYLTEALINSLRRSLGENGAKVLLRDVGIHMGEEVAETLTSRTKNTTWDPDTYAQHFINGFLTEMGFQPKVVSIGKDHVVYQERNCLFQELAVKYPGLICDILDETVHESINRSLTGGGKTIHMKCKGHGDPVCEHRVQWQRSARRPKNKLITPIKSR